jgi:hypothetical protein
MDVFTSTCLWIKGQDVLYTARTKDGFVSALEDVINYFAVQGHEVKLFRTASEQIMKWGPVKKFINKKGIKP